MTNCDFSATVVRGTAQSNIKLKNNKNNVSVSVAIRVAVLSTRKSTQIEMSLCHTCTHLPHCISILCDSYVKKKAIVQHCFRTIIICSHIYVSFFLLRMIKTHLNTFVFCSKTYFLSSFVFSLFFVCLFLSFIYSSLIAVAKASFLLFPSLSVPLFLSRSHIDIYVSIYCSAVIHFGDK